MAGWYSWCRMMVRAVWRLPERALVPVGAPNDSYTASDRIDPDVMAVLNHMHQARMRHHYGYRCPSCGDSQTMSAVTAFGPSCSSCGDEMVRVANDPPIHHQLAELKALRQQATDLNARILELENEVLRLGGGLGRE